MVCPHVLVNSSNFIKMTGDLHQPVSNMTEDYSKRLNIGIPQPPTTKSSHFRTMQSGRYGFSPRLSLVLPLCFGKWGLLCGVFFEERYIESLCSLVAVDNFHRLVVSSHMLSFTTPCLERDGNIITPVWEQYFARILSIRHYILITTASPLVLWIAINQI